MLNFIESDAPTSNRLLQAVAEDLRTKVYLAATRALGLVGKHITGPYFTLVGQTERVLDLNPHLCQLQGSLKELSQDGSHLLQGDFVIFDEEVASANESSFLDSLLHLVAGTAQTVENWSILNQKEERRNKSGLGNL